MSLGPVLIFDKSALQGLSVDESLWLDTFFVSNITPIFWVETLADLEKQLRKNDGRTAEDIVGNLALKTPELGGKVNVHHETLLTAELIGGEFIDMRFGRPIIPFGQPVELEGKKGIVFQPSTEEEAFGRWQSKEFIDLERTIAKKWRKSLSELDLASFSQIFRTSIEVNKPKNVLEAKELGDAFIDAANQEDSLILGMSLIGVPLNYQDQVLQRWKASGSPPIRKFAPYFSHVMAVDLCFYIGIASGLISGDRPSHKVDLSYLYYLPFCMVFSSEDRLHVLLAPLFMQDFQTFWKGSELKTELRKLNDHYMRLPDDVKESGVSSFAAYPPLSGDFRISELWDKYLPPWRDIASTGSPSPMAHIAAGEESPELNDWGFDSLTIVRNVYTERGNWKRFPPEVLKSAKS